MASNARQAAGQQAVQSESQSTVVGSGRQAAQGMEYKEKTALSLPDSKIAVKEEQTAADELQALEKTHSDTEGPRRSGICSCGLAYVSKPCNFAACKH